MKVIIKYEVKYRAFTDKETNKEVKINDVIDIDIDRMKILNEHNIGRVIDIIIEDETGSPSTNPEGQKVEDDPSSEKTGKEKYSQEQLNALTVNELKDLASKMEIELTKAKKDEIIEEILQNQK